MDEPPFALVCGWRYPLLIIAKGGSFSTVSTLRLFSSTSIACGFLYEKERATVLWLPAHVKTDEAISLYSGIIARYYLLPFHFPELPGVILFYPLENRRA